jgi:nucleotide-binding universal stress UspA family protein
MRVLLYTDGLPAAEAATTWLERFGPATAEAVRVAAIAQSPPRAPLPSAIARSLGEAIHAAARRAAETACERLRARWPELSSVVAEGDPHEQVLRIAEEWRADLVVLGRTAGGSAPAPVLGSVARIAARHLECSVLIVDRAPDTTATVVVGADSSPSVREAVHLLRQFHLPRQTRVLALGIVSGAWRQGIAVEDLPAEVIDAVRGMEQARAAEALARATRATADLVAAMAVEVRAAAGSPADLILSTARDSGAELLVLGDQGIEPVRRLALGSVAERMLVSAPCSLLIGRVPKR